LSFLTFKLQKNIVHILAIEYRFGKEKSFKKYFSSPPLGDGLEEKNFM
jgi:hypothetical protein